mmetsp:Transcript_20619/g.19601  ORF Transcript_20619/g.19601 Transcript_20619/m.19601 type:complete len:94 (-) Transcript_20619:5-286(-)
MTQSRSQPQNINLTTQNTFSVPVREFDLISKANDKLTSFEREVNFYQQDGNENNSSSLDCLIPDEDYQTCGSPQHPRYGKEEDKKKLLKREIQ